MMSRGKSGEADLAAASGDLAMMAPRDVIEARLAGLFLATTEAATRQLALASLTTAGPHCRDAVVLANQLARTATLLAEAMERRRRPAEQRIVVEQRVAVADGGRAVVGVAVQAGGGGGDGKTGRQPHIPAALVPEPGAPLPCASEVDG